MGLLDLLRVNPYVDPRQGLLGPYQPNQAGLLNAVSNPQQMTHYAPQSGVVDGGLARVAQNHMQRVMRGEVALEGLQNFRNTAEKAMAGDMDAAVQLGLDFSPGAIASIKAFHGSPHKFDKFRLDKIGTGEGAQAYGHGLYFAESPGVAKSYREALTAGRTTNQRGNVDLESLYSEMPSEPASMDQARQHLKNFIENGQLSKSDEADFLNLWKQKFDSAQDGNLYSVELKPNPEDLLDWDKPLSQQSEKVRKALAPLIEQAKKSFPSIRPDEMTGQGFYQAYMSHRGGNAVTASDAMRRLGIPGIKYLDQGSRTAGKGTSNYVIFDDELVKILNRE